MTILEIKDISDKVQRLGRTLDGKNGEISINWTCSGLKFMFKGTNLIAEFGAAYGEETDINPLDNTMSVRKTWPYIAVFLDGDMEPVRCFEVNKSSDRYLLFSSDNIEEHTITIRKVTENPKGKLSIQKFFIEGQIEKPEVDNDKLKIEFIGDSITCGFGNMSSERDRLFFSADENGWLSHAAVAARELEAEFSMISYSGISITEGLGNIKWPATTMKDLYPYSDRLEEEKNGESIFSKWSFEQSIPDVIVLNLGTNDATVIEANVDIARGVQKFEAEYYQFLKLIRDKNGKKPWIICSLGSMDYFMFDNIKNVVNIFSKENHDQRITCFKYSRIKFSEGYGACGHPNLITQMRMGKELAAFITDLLKRHGRLY
jgi:lysophospholipase L1-like esterase